MPLRILHTADVHLGRSFVQLGPCALERQGDLVDTFTRICDQAIAYDVAAVLIAGDLFDVYDPTDALVGQVQGQLTRLRNAGIWAYVIPGNHDEYSYPRSVWKRHEFTGAHVFTEPTFTTASFEYDGARVYVHGLAYDHTVCKDPLPTLTRSDDGVHIAMLHATVDVPDYQRVEQRYLPLSGAQLRGMGVDYVALGHIHRSHAYRDAQGLFASYPGSPEGLTAREVGDRYVALIEFDGGAPTLERVKVNKRTVVRDTVSVDDMTMAEMAGAIRNVAGTDMLLTASLTGSPRDVPSVENLVGQLRDRFFWVDIEDGTAMVNSLRIEEIAAENTIRGQFVRSMRGRIQAAEDDDTRVTLELALKFGFLELEKRSVA